MPVGAWKATEADAPGPEGAQRPCVTVLATSQGSDTVLGLAIAAWRHTKRRRNGSVETRAASARPIGELRSMARAQGLDLDAAVSRRVRAGLAASSSASASASATARAPDDAPPVAAWIEDAA